MSLTGAATSLMSVLLTSGRLMGVFGLQKPRFVLCGLKMLTLQTPLPRACALCNVLFKPRADTVDAMSMCSDLLPPLVLSYSESNRLNDLRSRIDCDMLEPGSSDALVRLAHEYGQAVDESGQHYVALVCRDGLERSVAVAVAWGLLNGRHLSLRDAVAEYRTPSVRSWFAHPLRLFRQDLEMVEQLSYDFNI